MAFGDVKLPIYGSYGEFNMPSSASSLRVNYVQTKIKPGSSGWESELASMMVPWREIFNIEEMTFDELLQRDLDDSRVAHDLIPYLLADEGHKAKFFPPILAVMVPMRADKTGIEKYYPEVSEDQGVVAGGDLFKFSPVIIDDQLSPLGKLDYDRQNTSFVIVDGQHRAMAVLALHRQLNKSWQGNRYESYYSHIDVSPEDMGHIELPVCILYFPDLCESNTSVVGQGIDLKNVCRDIFLVVNKSAKKVSSTRELLLDDDDFCARMMRSTLSKFKSRGEDDYGLSRIYSFSYGDDNDDGKVLKRHEYSSASFVHKFHAAISFGQSNSLKLIDTSEVTDGRRTQNNQRPPQLLRGSEQQSHASLSRFSAKSHSPKDSEKLVELLGNLVDIPLFDLFDKFRPFTLYNFALRSKKAELSQPEMKAQAIQLKSYALMFEGAGARGVFVDHNERLSTLKNDLQETGSTIPSYIDDQLGFTSAVLTAFEDSESKVYEDYACRFFNFDKDKVESSDPEGYMASVKKARVMFSGFQTQAFQMGFMMTVHTLLHRILPHNSSYHDRVNYLRNISTIVIDVLNAFYSEKDSKHKSVSGLIKKDRVDVFTPSGVGLRGLLKLSGILELNEKQWVFYRYALLEIIHSKYCKNLLIDAVKSVGSIFDQQWRDGVKGILGDVKKLRCRYIERSIEKAVSATDFEMEKMQKKAKLAAEGKSYEDIDEAMSLLDDTKKTEIQELAKRHIKASLGSVSENVYSDVYS